MINPGSPYIERGKGKGRPKDIPDRSHHRKTETPPGEQRAARRRKTPAHKKKKFLILTLKNPCPRIYHLHRRPLRPKPPNSNLFRNEHNMRGRPSPRSSYLARLRAKALGRLKCSLVRISSSEALERSGEGRPLMLCKYSLRKRRPPTRAGERKKPEGSLRSPSNFFTNKRLIKRGFSLTGNAQGFLRHRRGSIEGL